MTKNLSACIICGSENRKVLRKKIRYGIRRKVLQCVRCSLIFLEPLAGVSEAYYRSNKYRALHGPDLKKQSSPREIFNTYLPFQKPIIQKLEPILRPNMKVLDVGCSTGHFLEALRGRVKPRVGFELDEAAVKFIKRNLNFKVYSEPIERVNMAEGPFDLITALQVLEHVPDPFGFLSGIAINLKPNGYLYLELPNVSDVLLTVFKVKEYEDFYYREPHVYYYSKDTLGALLKMAGVEGKPGNVQRYNFLNHLNWILAGKPQSNFNVGNAQPVLVSAGSASAAIKDDFNEFIRGTDSKYKQLVGKYNLGENLTFLGRKKL